MEEDAELSRLRALFLSFDAKRSGRLGRGDFSELCAELRVSPAEVENIFRRLDTDRDGAITFEDFVMGFRGAKESREPTTEHGQKVAPSDEHHEDDSFSPAWKDFQLRLGEEASYIPR